MPLPEVHEEREVKVALTVHPEVTVVREATDADSMTRRRVPDQTTDLDSPVSAVVQVPQLRKQLYPKPNKTWHQRQDINIEALPYPAYSVSLRLRMEVLGILCQ